MELLGCSPETKIVALIVAHFLSSLSSDAASDIEPQTSRSGSPRARRSVQHPIKVTRDERFMRRLRGAEATLLGEPRFDWAETKEASHLRRLSLVAPRRFGLGTRSDEL
jgi:hypothetical protein